MNLLFGDCREVLKDFPDNHFDSIVTDPPYELGFMGKSWDSTGVAYDISLWAECLRVLKPGGHLLSFSGSRTYHRMAVAIEDAGFQIRDQIMWVYGSGFPKSMDISKAIDKAAGAEREVVGTTVSGKILRSNGDNERPYQQGKTRIEHDVTIPSTDEAQQWSGWGTALKPAHEPIVMARKPISGTIANNVLQHGTGAINIDKSRIGHEVRTYGGMSVGKPEVGTFRDDNWVPKDIEVTVSGRFPANFIHDGSEEVTDLLGEAARFFYCAKASKKDRNAGLEGLAEKEIGSKGNGLSRTCATCGASTLQGCECPDRTFENPTRANFHPTVKPTELMRYLVRLVTPPNGTVLDPFAGSGSTLVAAILEGFNPVGIEMTEDYLPIINGRTEWAKQQVTDTLF
jgi:site-specific DNA-methyltransferase (adenine-specific)